METGHRSDRRERTSQVEVLRSSRRPTLVVEGGRDWRQLTVVAARLASAPSTEARSGRVFGSVRRRARGERCHRISSFMDMGNGSGGLRGCEKSSGMGPLISSGMLNDARDQHEPESLMEEER